MRTPRLLDLYCGAGGAAMGYAEAGFEVVGVDHRPMPNYPFTFVQYDALALMALPFHYRGGFARFDAIHASPPCQAFTAYRRHGKVKPSVNLIPETRAALEATGLPFVIENVEPARPELREPVTLCGTMFDPPMEIQRHRLFETNWPLEPPTWPCRHLLNGKDRYPGGRSRLRTGNSRALVRGTIEVGTWDIPIDVQQRAMGMDWSTLEELSEAIPPAYTRHIGVQLREFVTS